MLCKVRKSQKGCYTWFWKKICLVCFVWLASNGSQVYLCSFRDWICIDSFRISMDVGIDITSFTRNLYHHLCRNNFLSTEHGLQVTERIFDFSGLMIFYCFHIYHLFWAGVYLAAMMVLTTTATVLAVLVLRVHHQVVHWYNIANGIYDCCLYLIILLKCLKILYCNIR